MSSSADRAEDFSEEEVSSNALNPPAKGRLMRRFYEPLVLLHLLDPFNGQRISQSGLVQEEFGDSDRELRRNFLKYLAYVCDYDPGGYTVTAVALEETPQGIVYWLAANRNPRVEVLDFLKAIINELQDLPEDRVEERRERLARRIVKFGSKRIKGYFSRLQNQLKICFRVLREKSSGEGDVNHKQMFVMGETNSRGPDRELFIWLKTFQAAPSEYRICNYCYHQRHDKLMRRLATEASTSITESEGESYAAACGLVRHCIGRLACHIRAARIFVDAGLRLQRLFNNFKFEFLQSGKSMKIIHRAESNIKLDKILDRMVQTDDPRLEDYKAKLALMDRHFELSRRLREKFMDPKFKTIVHAELILLQKFHVEGLRFVDADKYIACSKPACYCCYEYIRDHDGGFVVPSSSHRTFLGWRPPDIENDSEDRIWKMQRVVINRVLDKIDEQVLEKISQGNGPSPWRPSSTTAITPSLRGWRLQDANDSQVTNSTGFVSQQDSIASQQKEARNHSQSASVDGDDQYSAKSESGYSRHEAGGDGQSDYCDSDSGTDGGVPIGEAY